MEIQGAQAKTGWPEDPLGASKILEGYFLVFGEFNYWNSGFRDTKILRQKDSVALDYSPI